MITGDNTLTACQVSTTLKIVDKPVLILTQNDHKGEPFIYIFLFHSLFVRIFILIPALFDLLHSSEDEFNWVSVDEQYRCLVSHSSTKSALLDYDLCISGEHFGSFISNAHLLPLLSEVKVFARISPDQKVISINTTRSF